MRFMTLRKVLVEVKEVPFNAKTFNLLLQLSVIVPNLALEAEEVHTRRPMKVKLFQLDLDWATVSRYNLDVA